MPRFCDEFLPSRGDLLYGIADTRVHYWNYFIQEKPSNAPKSAQQDPWVFIDHYIDHFSLHPEFTGYGMEAMRAVNKITEACSKDRQSRASTYWSTLIESRFCPDGDDERADIKRICKFGIGLALTKFEGAKVHFVLDGIDLGRMAKEDPFRRKKPYTKSELRFVYRQFKTLSDFKRLLFYVNYETVNAPWDEDWTLQDAFQKTIKACKADWDDYGLRRKDNEKTTRPLY